MTGTERIRAEAERLQLDVVGEPIYQAGRGWTVHVRHDMPGGYTVRIDQRSVGAVLAHMRNLSAGVPMPTDPAARVNT